MSKAEWKKLKEQEKNKNKEKNLGATGITSFKSRSFADWQKSGGKNLFPVDPKKAKSAKEIPYVLDVLLRNACTLASCECAGCNRSSQLTPFLDCLFLPTHAGTCSVLEDKRMIRISRAKRRAVSLMDSLERRINNI